MSKEIPLYPLRFEPMFQYRLWGGRRFESLLGTTLPGKGPIGEAWVLSDRPDHSSQVVNGPLKGRTITQLMEDSREQLLGPAATRFSRFPLLLKFLDAQEVLSVQVHPSDDQKELLPPGECGKTEAWVVLEADEKSIVYGGLTPGTDKEQFKTALEKGNIQDKLAHFKPGMGDTIFIPAGTVHTMGGIVVFEVQENSDMTFRLYDWGHVDKQTGKPRQLHIEEGLASINFPQDPVAPVIPVDQSIGSTKKELLVRCDHFTLWRIVGKDPFPVGAPQTARVVVCVEGEGQLEHSGSIYRVRKGEVWLLPAHVGRCEFQPRSQVDILELALP